MLHTSESAMLRQSNLSASEREVLAYLSGAVSHAADLHELAEVQERMDGIENHGVYGAEDLQQIIKERDDAMESLEDAAKRLEDVTESLQEALGRLSDDAHAAAQGTRGARRAELLRIAGELQKHVERLAGL
jgi:DNA repair ATPase RecN